jgi:hypothetical protein
VKVSRKNAVRFLAILFDKRSENISFSSFHRLECDPEMNVTLRTVARSVEKTKDHAEILSSNLRSPGESWEALRKPWEA